MRVIFQRKHLLWLFSAVFLLGGIILLYQYRSTQVDYIPFLENRIETALDEMEDEAETLAPYFGDMPLRFDEVPVNTRYAHYAYENGNLVFWTDYRFVPEYNVLAGGNDLKRVSTLRHEMLVLRRHIGDLEFYSVLPLEDRYKIDNSYVQSGINETLFGTAYVEITEDGGDEVCPRTSCMFSVNLEQPLYKDGLAIGAVILFWLFFLTLFIGVCTEGWSLAVHGRILRGLLFLSGGLIVIRVVMLSAGLPASVYPTALFNPINFSSSVINPTLGDLFLNLVVAVTILLFIQSFISERLHRLRALKIPKFLFASLLSGLLILCFHYQYIFIQTLYHNSQLSFDINESLQFDILRITGFGVIILNAVISFLTFHILFIIIQAILGNRRFYFPLLAGALLFAAVNFIIGQSFVIPLIIAVIYAVILFYTGLFRELSGIRYRTFLYLFAGIFFTSLLFTFTIHEFENKREINRKIRFANQFLIENDNLAEFLLNEAVQDIAEDVFIQSRLSSPFMSKDVIRSKIRQVHLSNYFDKYDVKIHIYNPNFQPYDIPSDITPREIQSWRAGEYATNYDHVYFINRLEDRASKRYVTLVEVERRGITVGYVLIDMALKRIIPHNVYPELLVDNRFLEPYENAEYSYAVMEGQRITYNAGEFNYQRSFEPGLLGNEELYSGGIARGGYDHLGIRAPQNKIVVISSKTHPVAHLISNFSFFFLLLVSVTLLIAGIYALYYYYRNVDLTYSAKIQLYLNVAFFLPLIAVSLTTLSVINSSFRQDQQDEYFQKAQNIGISLSDELEDYLSSITLEEEEELPDALNFIGNVTGLDVNLFSTRGRLLATSQPQIYENELLSSYINPAALSEIRDGGQNFQIVEESVGSLVYNNTFYGVRSYESGRLIGILSIPFFESANELEQNQIEVLTNVMNIFTVVFIIFLILSSLASDWLTFPLRFITQKLKKTTLTGFNEPLSWQTDDEIGLMVSEYNRMLENLEESKKALARSQKETAWREIAQQVAHEIKNPLTPMKLTLQHLSRRFGSSNDDLKKPINSLLHQVDTLSDIASSFSSFAKLPIPEHERFEITAILRNTVQLFNTSENAEIKLNIPDHPVYIMGDEKLMGRILSNIVLNAIQSYASDHPHVEIDLQLTSGDKALIEVRDFGRGIDSSIHSKIFIPNFTTKESGSGIGLAVAKHGVEHAGGKIWFETSEGEGTSFFIELPVVE